MYRRMVYNARIYASQLVDTLPYIRSDEESLRASRAYIRGWIKEGRRKRRVGSPGPQCLSFVRFAYPIFPPIYLCSIDTHVRSSHFVIFLQNQNCIRYWHSQNFLPYDIKGAMMFNCIIFSLNICLNFPILYIWLKCMYVLCIDYFIKTLIKIGEIFLLT